MAKPKLLPQVVIVDDEQTSLLIMEEMLADAKYDVKAFMNVLEAKQYLEIGAGNVHLVISDINMPEMSGLEFCRMICGLKGFENMPVMLVSAISDLKTVSDGYEAGCFDYIVKPLAQESFLPKVANAVQQREKLLKFESKASKATNVAFSAMESGNQLATIIALS